MHVAEVSIVLGFKVPHAEVKQSVDFQQNIFFYLKIYESIQGLELWLIFDAHFLKRLRNPNLHFCFYKWFFVVFYHIILADILIRIATSYGIS